MQDQYKASSVVGGSVSRRQKMEGELQRQEGSGGMSGAAMVHLKRYRGEKNETIAWWLHLSLHYGGGGRR